MARKAQLSLLTADHKQIDQLVDEDLGSYLNSNIAIHYSYDLYYLILHLNILVIKQQVLMYARVHVPSVQRETLETLTRVAGGLEPIPADIGREAEYSLETYGKLIKDQHRSSLSLVLHRAT